MTKSEIRTYIRRLKAQRLSAASVMDSGAEVAALLTNHARVKAAQTILLYHPLPDEVDTRPLLTALAGKTLLLPVVVGDTLELRHYTGETRVGAFGIEEPVGPVFTDYDKIDLAIIPGMAFTRDGKRLGRGKGYYDRLLPKLTSAYLLGLCYDWQVVDDIPTEPHDMPVNDIYICSPQISDIVS